MPSISRRKGRKSRGFESSCTALMESALFVSSLANKKKREERARGGGAVVEMAGGESGAVAGGGDGGCGHRKHVVLPWRLQPFFCALGKTTGKKNA